MMNLNDELSQLNAYYEICNYNGRLTAGSLIDGIQDILSGKKETVDIHSSNREELENRIAAFYSNIEEYL